MPEFWLNFGATIGILILAIPTLKMNKLRRRQSVALDKLSASEGRGDELLKAVAQLGVEKREEQLATWSVWDQRCLYGGYLLLLGSNMMRLIPF